MSRLKASGNTSKTVYQGIVLNRTHRSEYDDNQLRDQARHNSRLDQEIKNVERARTVMAKSMEADKQLFIKSGAQNNIRVTKSKQSVTHARQQALASQAASTAASQPHRHLVSDSRVRRSSLSDTDTVDTATSASRSSKQGQPKTAQSSNTPDQRQQKDNNNNNKSVNNITNTSTSSNKDGNNNNRHTNAASSRSKDSKALPTTDDGQPNLDSIYDDFLSVNLNDPATTKPGHALATPVRQLGTRSGMITGMDRSGALDQTSTKSSHNAPEKRLTLSVEAGSSSKGGNQERTGQTTKLDNLAGRPRTKWDNLATPKHSSPHLTKRAQIEQEFARPTARNSPSSPAAQQTRLVGTYTLTAGSSTPTPVATTTTIAASSASASTLGSSSTPRKKSAHSGRK